MAIQSTDTGVVGHDQGDRYGSLPGEPRSVAQLRPMMLGRKSQPRPGLDRLVEAFKTPSKAPQKATSKPPQNGSHGT